MPSLLAIWIPFKEQKQVQMGGNVISLVTLHSHCFIHCPVYKTFGTVHVEVQ